MTRRRFARVAVALLALLVVTAPAPASAGHRIISIVPAVTEMLFAIGAGPEVVAVSSYDRYPEAVGALPRVGALLDPDVERILSLAPDLVVVYGSQSHLIAQLEGARIPVFSYRHGGLADVTATMRALGRRTDHAREADAAADAVERRLEAIRDRVRERPRPRTLLVFGRGPLTLRNVYAAGGVGFLHDLLTLAGGEDVFGDVPRESVQTTTETLLARAPEVILEIRAEAPADVERERRVWAALPSVPAVRANRIQFLTGSEMVVPGPRVVEAAERLARALHPEAFEGRP